jgi:hypothetical protein
MAKARADGWKEKKIAAMRPSCATLCHRYRLKAAWAARVNRGGKIIDRNRVGKGRPDATNLGILPT